MMRRCMEPTSTGRFCHEIEDEHGDPNCEIDLNVRGLDDDMLFSIFLGDYQRILRETGGARGLDG